MKLPSGWANEPERTPVEQQAQEAIFEATGAVVEPVFDDKIHRFKVEGDAGNEKSGWYVLHGNKLPAGAFGSWKSGEDWIKWRANGIDEAANRAGLEKIWREIRERRDREQKKIWSEAADTCRRIWEMAEPASLNNPYLKRKKVRNHGLKQTGDGRLIVPVYVGAELTSLQYIDADGGKQYHPGGRVGGGYFRISARERAESRTRFITEGYATGASVHEATGCEVWVAFSAGNLKKVGAFLRENLPDDDLCFVGDNDESGVGQKKAQEAAEAVKARCVIIPERGDANDYATAGKDLKGLLVRKKILNLKHYKDFIADRQPIRWLIKGWIRAEAQMMIFGASGCGKTFVVLDMAMSIACPEIESWKGEKVRHGPVAYLAGEGYAGLKQRVAGWQAYKGISTADLYITETSVSVDTGDVMPAIEEIEEAFGDRPPKLIVIDPLISWMAGDENKAQDARNMLAVCAKLYQHFGCSVLLIHHTGVSQDAQMRARGSSAWRGAMDMEIAVISDNFPYITLSQTKNKDAKQQDALKLELKTIDVPEWFDEDGEQISTLVPELSGEVDVEDEKPLTANQNTAVLAYDKAAKTKGRLDADGKFAGLDKESWREVFYAMTEDKTPTTQRVSFHRAIKDLEKLGWISTNDEELYMPAGLWAIWERGALAKELAKNGGN